MMLLVQLYAVPGNESLLIEYEDQVLRLLPRHAARLIQRLRSIDPRHGPLETHIIAFESEGALEHYMADPERLALSGLRDRAIARTEVTRVQTVVS